MALIKSISGIRGTIGGQTADNLTPIDIVANTTAYARWLLNQGSATKVVLGRDARISGAMVNGLVANTLVAMGIDVIDLGLSTTPTVEMAVTQHKAGGGIILTASHNPKQWNALKLLNEKGEFLNQADGDYMADQLNKLDNISFASVDQLGKYIRMDGFEYHIDQIMALLLVDPTLVRKKNYRIVVDAVNSTGALAMPQLLNALGCEVMVLHDDVSGNFAHNPEPLPKHLGDLAEAVITHQADLGIAVDPDVDRLALVSEDGSFFGEEYTLVAIADYYLRNQVGNTVSNLSSSRALADVTQRHGGTYYASAVGEVNVVAKMKAVQAVIGGEGNGGIIVPELHYGRDALAGAALFLSFLAQQNTTASALRATYPNYEMVKDKIPLDPNLDVDALLGKLASSFANERTSTIDGLKVDFPDRWVHFRKSNTEPIVRIYAEAPTQDQAEELVQRMKETVDALSGE